MKHCMTLLLAWLVLTIPAFTHAATWQIDPDHSSFQFKVRHLTVSNVKGDFSKARGVVTFDDQDITKMTVELTIDAASVNTGNVKRDEHLKGPDFFDVTQYPTITFASKKVTRAGTNKLKVIGNLTIHGTTKEIAVDVEGPTPEVKDPWGNFRCGATATANINRMDFGLTWNKALDSGGLVVGEEVNIYIEVELVRK